VVARDIVDVVLVEACLSQVATCRRGNEAAVWRTRCCARFIDAENCCVIIGRARVNGWERYVHAAGERVARVRTWFHSLEVQ
jgi:hypothetical protein